MKRVLLSCVIFLSCSENYKEFPRIDENKNDDVREIVTTNSISDTNNPIVPGEQLPMNEIFAKLRGQWRFQADTARKPLQDIQEKSTYTTVVTIDFPNTQSNICTITLPDVPVANQIQWKLIHSPEDVEFFIDGSGNGDIPMALWGDFINEDKWKGAIMISWTTYFGHAVRIIDK